MKASKLIPLNIALGTIAYFTIKYSADHYGDAGCDGGLCGLLFLFHGLPLILVWVLEIIAINLSLKGSWMVFILLPISYVINTIVYFKNYEYRLNKLSLESEILYFLAAIGLSIYVWSDFVKKTNESDNLYIEKKKIENFHPVFYSSLVLWFMSDVFFYLKLVQTNHALLNYYLLIAAYLILITFIFMKLKWAQYILIALLIYRIGSILFFNTTHVVTFVSQTLIISNLYLILGVYLQLIKSRKGTLQGENIFKRILNSLNKN